MNRNPAAPDGAGGAVPVDLAREPPFALAKVTVTPAALRMEAGGWSQRLEPRAMQVLVVLARMSPEVVGRGILNARVWGGRVVGEDAINRTVQTLRRIAAAAPAPAPFTIETIPRIGYRLRTEGDGQAAPVPAAWSAPPMPQAEASPAPGLAAPTMSAAPHPARLRQSPRIWIAAVLAVLAAILLWRVFAGPLRRSGDWQIAGTSTLDDLPPGAVDLALSPDGRHLAYRSRDETGRERIFVRAADRGGMGDTVSPADIDARRPAWNADGTSLAFAAYDPGQPCRLYTVRSGRPATPVGRCETTRDPHLAWSADGRSLLFGDAPGENAVQRISAVRLADGQRMVLSSPPGDSLGDGSPVPRGGDIVFQRLFGWADEGWIAHDLTTGRERLLWRRRGVAGSVATPLPDGTIAVAWTRAGASGLDFVGTDGRLRAQPVALGPVTALSAAGSRLLVETDRSESALARARNDPAAQPALAMVNGRIAGPVLLPGGGIRFAATAAGVARLWESDGRGVLRPWGGFMAARIAALAPSPDGRLTAALVTGNAGREIVLFDAGGRPVYRWNPHARSVNAAVWSGDGRHLIVPLLDAAGWRLFAIDPFARAAPRDLDLPGFAVLLGNGSALYAVRAGETTGTRELWRLDGTPRRLPIDLTLFDIVNWRPSDAGIWLPDRSDHDHPRLVLREIAGGRMLRSVPAPGLAGSGSGLAADARGPVYVRTTRDAPEYAVLSLTKTRD